MESGVAEDESCPLCQREDAEVIQENPELDWAAWGCGSCGRFKLWGRCASRMEGDVHTLRGLATERRLRGQSPLVIRPDTLDDLVAQGPHHPVEQGERLLVNLAYRSSEPTLETSLSTSEARAFSFARHPSAAERWLDILEHEGFIEYDQASKEEPNNLSFCLTLDGWRRVRELWEAGVESDIGFVAMGFDDEYDALWADGIKPGIEAAGWTAVRADKEDHTDRIDDWILNQISKAAFVVADTTENNPGVCFEAGYAQGLGVPVIWTTRKDMTSSGSPGSEANGEEEDHQLHFDLRQYNHLTWVPGKQADLSDDLEQRIRHRVGDGDRTSGMRSPFME